MISKMASYFVGHLPRATQPTDGKDEHTRNHSGGHEGRDGELVEHFAEANLRLQ